MRPTMSKNSLHELLQTLRYTYRQSPSKGAKSLILDQWCRVSRHERKYAIKELRAQRGPSLPGSKSRVPTVKRGGSLPRYGPDVAGLLKAIWMQHEQPCGKRLLAVLPLLVLSWERHHGEISSGVKSGLLAISASQIDRVLAPFRVKLPGRRPFPGSEVREMEVKGRNLSEGVPRSFTISSNEILEALTDPLNNIVSAVKNALEQTPPELGADIAERGMMLTGGGALLRDLDRLMAEETGLPVLVAEDPLTCVVRGCGLALERMERLGSIFTSE